MLRGRPVAGSQAVADEFQRIRRETLSDHIHRDSLLEDVTSMRARMRENLDRSTDGSFDLKQGQGGIADIEFLVQYLVLKHADNASSLLDWSDNIRQLDALASEGLLPADDVEGLQSAYRGLRHRSHRLTLDGLDTVVDASEFAEERDLVTALWHREMK